MNMLIPKQPEALDLEVRVPSTDVWGLLGPALATVPGGPPQALLMAGAMLNIMAGIDQADSIRRIDANLARQVKAPLRAGRDHLYGALKLEQAELRKEFLLLAANQFTLARHVDLPPDTIRATTYLAVCFQCLGEQALADDYYQKSYAEAERRRQKLLADLASLTRQAGIYYPAAMTLAVTGVAPVAYFIWQENASKRFFNGFTEIFDLERQMLQLRRLPALQKAQPELKPLFPPPVTEIQKWQVTTSGENTGKPALFAFDQQGQVVMCLHLTDGQPLSAQDIKGIFARNGQHFSAGWRPAE